MTRHSKNNCSGSVFTYAERHGRDREVYAAGALAQTSETKKSVDTCFMCMNRSTDPVLCGPTGHIGCRECFLTSILQQKRTYKKLLSEYEKLKFDKVEEGTSKIESFERQQRILDRPEVDPVKPDQKLASFWNISPKDVKHDLKKPSKDVVCKVGKPHELSISSLIPISMKYLNDQLVCFQCDRGIIFDAVVSRNCGHLFCVKCSPKDGCSCGCTDAKESGLINVCI